MCNWKGYLLSEQHTFDAAPFSVFDQNLIIILRAFFLLPVTVLCFRDTIFTLSYQLQDLEKRREELESLLLEHRV